MRMRTIDAAIEQLHADDPGNCLTRYALRQMILAGTIPSVKVGQKYLLNYDDLPRLLADPHCMQAGEDRTSSKQVMK